MKSIFILVSPLLIFVFFYHVTTSNAQEVENELEFDYVPGSAKGPQHWGELKPEWAKCKYGNMQSPTDLYSYGRIDSVPKSEALTMYYKPSNAVLKNRGHDVQVVWSDDAGSIQINGVEYPLRSTHWHSPSEHTVDGKRFDLEMHLVHQYTDANKTAYIAVIALLFEKGPPDPFLWKLTGTLESLVDAVGTQANLGVVDPHDINIGGKNYYRYRGSLTTPPCSEGVIWTVKKKIKTVSIDQLHLLRAAVHDRAENNARPLQPLNGRCVNLFTQLAGCPP